jgi:hypothetical protein
MKLPLQPQKTESKTPVNKWRAGSKMNNWQTGAC